MPLVRSVPLTWNELAALGTKDPEQEWGVQQVEVDSYIWFNDTRRVNGPVMIAQARGYGHLQYHIKEPMLTQVLRHRTLFIASCSPKNINNLIAALKELDDPCVDAILERSIND